MSVVAVARKDYRDGIRSKLLWGLIALFVISIVGLATLFTDGEGPPVGSFEVLVLFAISAMPAILVLVPLTGLLVSIKSIARERELGSIKLLLSLPHTRGEVLAGKFVGRSALLATAIVAGFVPGAIVLAIRYGTFPVGEFLVLLAVVIAFGIAFVAVGLGVSAMVATETRATIAGVAVFFALYFWDDAFGYVNDELSLLSGDPLLFVERFNLIAVFFDAMLALLSLREDVPSASIVALEEGGGVENGIGLEAAASHPVYLDHWVAFLILGVWIVVPLAIGYWRFGRTDL